MQRELGTLEASTFEAITVLSGGKGICLGRNEIAESGQMSGQVSSSGQSGLSRNFMNKFAPSSCFMKPQGSEQKKSMSPSARWPAKRMSLKRMGCKACSHPGSKAGQEKQARPCRK